MKRITIFICVFVLLACLSTVLVSAYTDYGDYYDEYYEDDYSYDGDEAVEFNLSGTVMLSLGVGLVIALIITGIMRAGMKSVRAQRAASNYIRRGSMTVVRRSDVYLYSHVTKTARPQNNNKR